METARSTALDTTGPYEAWCWPRLPRRPGARGSVQAAPGTVLFSDDFESGTLTPNWTVNALSWGANAGVGTQTAASGTHSLYTNGGAVTVTSGAVDLSAVPAARLTYWVRRGDPAFSELPDNGEDLEIQYLDAASNWVTLQTYAGGGTAGEVFNGSVDLPAGAFHAGFQLRVAQTGGSGWAWDYWHVDDVTITETGSGGGGSCAGVNATYYDQNGTQRAYFTGNTVSRIDSTIDFDWSNSSPDPGIGADDFTSRWDGDVEVPSSGSYIFRTRSDDGVRLWIDGNLVIDQWNDHGPTYHTSAPIVLQAGQRYTLRMEHYERGGQAVAQLAWDSGSGGASYSVIPASQLSHCAGSGGPQPVAYYAMDESSWNGSSNEVRDASGNGHHGQALGGAQTDTGYICRGGAIARNTSQATQQAVDTGVDVDAQVGNSGTISFWYKSNARWNGNNGDRQLLDASDAATGKYFYLVLQNNSRLEFGLEDGNDDDFRLQGNNHNFNAGEWVHIAVTWDLAADRMQIYVNGNLDASTTINSSGVLGDLATLYAGDNRSTYFVGASSPNSGNGTFDELRIYQGVLSGAQIQTDMNATHPCVAVDHFAVSHSGTGVNCQAEPVTIQAHLLGHGVDGSYTGTVSVLASNGSTGHGDWTLQSGAGTLSPGAPDSGSASYTFAPADNGQVVLALKDTHPETVNIDVADSFGISEQSGAAQAAEDPDLAFAAAGFRFVDASDAESIGTQIAGKPSDTAPGAQNLYLQAIRTDNDTGSCVGVFGSGQTANVELGSLCTDPGSCQVGRQVSVSNAGTTASIANPQNPNGASSYSSVPLTFGAGSRAALSFAYPDAGRIQLRARYMLPLQDGSASGTAVAGNSPAFVVRPFAFRVSVPGNPGAADDTGPAFIRAGKSSGDAFQADIQAVQWQAGDDADQDGAPDGFGDADPGNNAVLSDNGDTPSFGNESAGNRAHIGLSAVHQHPATALGGTAGTLGGAPVPGVTASGGSASTGTVLRYSEVGVIELDAATGDYFGGLGLSGGSGPVGRFYPDHFVVAGTPALTNRSDLSCSPASGFTYMDEDFELDFTLEAVNADGNITRNYETVAGQYDYARLVLSPGGGLHFGAIDSPGSGTATPLILRLSATGVTGAFSDGTANVSSSLRLQRAAGGPDGPYRDLRTGVAPLDADGVRLANTVLNLDPGATGTATHRELAGTEVRFGRAVVENAFGSEYQALPVPLLAQYYDGSSGWVLNTDDYCTKGGVALADVDPNDNLNVVAGDTCVQDIGTPGLSGAGCRNVAPAGESFSEPANAGSMNLWLQAPGEDGSGKGKYGAAEVTATGLPSYLLYFDYNKDGTLDPPTAQARFGSYRGDDRIIYWKENL